MTEPDETQQVVWPWLKWAILLATVGAAVMISLISAGVFDPKPIGDRLGQYSLQQVELGSRTSHLEWLDKSAPASDYSLRLTAALADGELDSAYGLALGDEDHYLVVAFSPVGYVSFWRQDGDRLVKLIPWRTWPHVNPPLETNELWFDVTGERLTSIRTNREILWQGDEALAGRQIGLWAESFGGPAIFDFQRLETFADPSSE